MGRKLSSLIKEVLYEQKEKSIKVFYSTDIFIQEFPQEKEPEEEPVTQNQTPTQPEIVGGAEAQAAQPEVVGAAESTEDKGKLLTEEIFKSKTKGELTIPSDKSKSILTLNDLLEYLDDQKDEEGKEIINDLVVEVIRALSGEETNKAVQDLLNKGDKCNIVLDYGFDKEDSIGLQVSKNAGVNLATMIMRKDGSPMTGQFNLEVFNQTITGVFLKELE